MTTVGKLEMKTDKDVAKDTEISLLELFPYAERVKEFSLETDVTRDQTRLKVTIAKLGSIDAIADATRKKDEKIHLWALMKYTQTSKKIKASEAIKKDDLLAITVETA
jgi:hypothetical protein